MDLQLTGKTAFVMGASRGLGRGIARALVQEGVNVALVARNAVGLETVATALTAEGPGRAIACAADQNDWPSLERAIDRAESTLGAIDILLNNSGGPPPSGVANIAPDLWRQQFEAMVLSIFQTTDRLIPGMRSAGWGRILTIASSTVIEPSPTLGVSNTLRSAIVGWSKTLAGELARDGITVNLLLPGRIATDRLQQLDQAAADRQGVDRTTIEAARAAAIPVGRYGTVEEFAALAAFLASPRAAYVTGSMHRIDGGALVSV